MIQVSPQTSVSANTSVEAGKTAGPEQGSLKKDKLGVFARLLEGLIGKRKTGSPAGADLHAAGVEGEEAPEKSGAPEKPGSKGLKKSALSAKGSGENQPAEALARVALLQTQAAPDPGEKATAKARSEGRNSPVREQPISLEVPENALKKDALAIDRELREALSPFAGTEKAEDLPSGEELLRELLGESIPEGNGRSAPERDRAPRSLADMLPERNLEGEAFQVSGFKRAGLQAAAREGEEGGREGRVSEARNNKRKERVSFQVQDLRTGEGLENSPIVEKAPADRVASPGDYREAELIVNLRSGGEGREERSNAGNISAPGRAFEDLLARELHQNLNGDIVRHASIILRNGGEGTVRLSLRPESLGNVKIQLEMAENKITGHIVVESGEALRAFEQEIRSLEQAFRESGFESAALDMSLAQGGGWEGQGGQWQDRERENPFTETLAAALYDTAAGTTELSGAGPLQAASGREALNMLV